MGNNESFGVHTDVTKLINLERKIRPYRMAIIKITQNGDVGVICEYLFNEFESSLVTISSSGPGLYELDIDINNFHDTSKVVQESYFNHTTIASPILITTFSEINRASLYISTFSLDNFNFEDFNGEIIVCIKEFYG
jgi:hypothetical protein